MAIDTSLFGASVAGNLSNTQSIYNQQMAVNTAHMTSPIANGGTLGRRYNPETDSWATGNEDLQVNVRKVGNGFVMNHTTSHGDRKGNVVIAKDIKELGDLFTAALVNNLMEK